MKTVQKKAENIFYSIYKILYSFYGLQKWWPAKTRFEVIIGAILTQNTAWTNVEKAIYNLKSKKMLDAKSIAGVTPEVLGEIIRPAGYFNLKAQRLKNFCSFLFEEYGGCLSRMFKQDVQVLRGQLLKVKGLGEETADSILLYAGNKPVFVVDAYTRRIFSRHKLISIKDKYANIQNKFMLNLKNDVKLFNEYHALIVALGKSNCRSSSPACSTCPLKGIKG